MIDKKYLPSKKFQVTLSIAIAIILIAVFVNFIKSSVSKYRNAGLEINASSSLAAINLDSDKDGLADWKEGLYGTDPKKTDTDEDGTSDLDEISQDRDPVKANTAPKGEEPNDKIDPAIVEKNQKALEEYEKLNEMDKFSRDLVSNIIASQPTSGSMDQDTVNSILAKSLSELKQKNYSGITKSTDLNLLKTDNTNLKKNMTDYKNSYYNETQKLVPILGTDINLMDSYVTNDSEQTKLEMLKLTDKYQAVINNLIKMPVPVAIGYYDINYHLAIINYLEILIAIDKDAVNADKNSLTIFSNLPTYNAVISNLVTVLTTVDSILKINR